MKSNLETRIFKTPVELFEGAAKEFAEVAEHAIRHHGRFCVVLSGGSTPKGLYSLLATGKFAIPWEHIFFFWGDERHVPPNHPESNYRMACEAMLSKVPVPPGNIFRIHSEEKDAALAAQQYQQTIIDFFGLTPATLPRFDLVLLGIGTEGHTASLFPDTAALAERSKLVVANWVEKLNTDRITLTLPVLNHAAEILFLVSGNEKAAIVKEILEGETALIPAQRVRPSDGKLLWLLDEAAASGLSTCQRVG